MNTCIRHHFIVAWKKREVIENDFEIFEKYKKTVSSIGLTYVVFYHLCLFIFAGLYTST